MRPFKTRTPVRDDGLSYAESKRLARDGDPEVCAGLAERQDLRPEILYFLAEDDSAKVRCRIAANLKTPRQADLILARDNNEAVRHQLANKIQDLLPELDADAQAQAHNYLVEVIEAANGPAAYAERFGVDANPFDFVWFTPVADPEDPCAKFADQLRRARERHEKDTRSTE